MDGLDIVTAHINMKVSLSLECRLFEIHPARLRQYKLPATVMLAENQ